MPSSSRPAGSAPALNLAIVRGTLSSDPVARELPSGDVLWSFEITVRAEGQPTDSVPVVQVGGRSPRLAAGDAVVAVGRVRRRFFRAGGTTASRTELVADRVAGARRTASVRAALDDAARRLTTADPG